MGLENIVCGARQLVIGVCQCLTYLLLSSILNGAGSMVGLSLCYFIYRDHFQPRRS